MPGLDFSLLCTGVTEWGSPDLPILNWCGFSKMIYMVQDDVSDPEAQVSPGLDQCAEMVSNLWFRDVSGRPRIQAGGLAGSTARPSHPPASHRAAVH